MNLKGYFSILILLLSTFIYGQNSYTLTTAGNGTWTVPAGVYGIKVECLGGGGGGGRATNSGRACAGGGGGAYARKDVLCVTPGQVINFSVGTAGVGGSGAKDGGDTWFLDQSTVLAKGGKGTAENSMTASQGGQAAASVGDTKQNGGNGGAGSDGGGSYDAGGGGGAAGSTAAGMNGGPGDNSASTAGTNGTRAGGNAGAGYPFTGTTGRGGNGSDNAGTGTASVVYGAGGGGGKRADFIGGSNDGGAGSRGAILITVIQGGIADAGLDMVDCNNTGVQIGVASQLGLTYSWSPATALSSATVSNPTATPAQTTTYTLTAVGVCGTTTDEVTVSVGTNLTPTISIAQLNSVLCSGTAADFTASVTNGSGTITYAWYVNGTVQNGAVGATFSTTTLTNGATVHCIATVNSACASNLQITSNTITATVFPSYNTNLTLDLCSNDLPYQFGNQTLNAGGNYTNVFTTANGCDSTVNLTLNVVSGPTFQIVTSNLTCNNDFTGSAKVVVTNGANATYLWQPIGATTDSIGGLPAGNYTVVVSNGACSSTGMAIITEPSALTFAGTATDYSCINGYGTYQAVTNGGTVPYQYTLNGGVQTQSFFNNLIEGNYNLSVTDLNGCSATTTFVINKTDDITVDLVSDVNPLQQGNTAILAAQTSPVATNYVYTWSNTPGLSCYDCPNPSAALSETSTVYVTVKSQFGCEVSDSLLIKVLPICGDFFIPTAFSPNGDGENEIFKPYSNCMQSYIMKIFDRYGERVYEGSEEDEGWDGSFRGKAMNAGVYYYFVEMTTVYGDTEIGKGSVSLVK